MSLRYQGGIVLPGYNPLKVANAPTIGTATAGNAQVSVAFTAPSCVGGGAISSYTAFANCGVKTASGASSPLVVTGLTNGTAYTFKVIATNVYGPSYPSASSSSVTPTVVTGQQAYTTANTYTWVAPAGVTSVSVVAVSAGGSGATNGNGGSGGMLGYKNNVSVTPGNSYSIVVGASSGVSPSPGGRAGASSAFTMSVCGGRNGANNGSTGLITNACNTTGTPGTAGGGGGNGGAGGAFSGYGGSPGAGGGGGAGAGGGAGGYTGGGGGGGAGYGGSAGGAGAGGGGGGAGGGGSSFKGGAGGGGVGILGQGSSGSGGGARSGGAGGSSGATGSNSPSGYSGASGGLYGGGGGGGSNCCCGGGCGAAGAGGAVRIIWPGTTRSFPSTNTGDL